MAVSEVRTQIYLAHDQHEALKRTAKEKAVSMAQIVREAVGVYLGDKAPAGTDPATDESAYLSDSAWKLLEAAEEIGGSGSLESAAKLEEELYGPLAK